MLTGRAVSLREIRRSDLAVIHRDLGDVVTGVLGDAEPWRPDSLARREAKFDRALSEPLPEGHVSFAVQQRDDGSGTLIGTCSLWGIDQHNGLAHLGLQLVPAVRGRGFGTDVVRVLCHYAFVVRSLHRVGLETLATNEPMRRAAVAAGFSEEGQLREAAFVFGDRVDEVLYGLLRSEWQPDPQAPPLG